MGMTIRFHQFPTIMNGRYRKKYTILAVRNQGTTKNVYQYIYTKGNYVIYMLPSSTFLRGTIIISAKWVVTIGHSFASPWESIKYQAKLKEEALL